MPQSRADRKASYFDRIITYFEKFDKVLVIGVDNVGSNQLQKLRQSLRKDCEVLMGKNTMIRKALRGHLSKNPALEKLLPHLVGNVGFIFTSGDLKQIREKIAENRVPAAAKAGTFAQCDVVIPAGPTGMEPTMTSFFQALNIPTKINKGQIEIQSDVTLLKEGQRVGNSEQTLLQKLNIKPFKYGAVIQVIYENGVIYEPKVLDIGEEEISQVTKEGIHNIAAVSLAIGYPTQASIPYTIISSLKNLFAVSLVSEYTMPQAVQLKDLLDNPEALAQMVVVNAVPNASAGGVSRTEEKQEQAQQQEEEEEEDEDLGLGLFD
ncbi:60S acidic ribosomal protein P0 [Galdieria sulphuraria]|nr:60S acidic ribosomal protein P0 [Galdieria sulphuraria]